MTETPPSLGDLCPGAPPALVRLVESAMSRDRDHRPATAADFMARLQEAVAGLPRPGAASPQATAPYDAVALEKLDGAVLVDLAGDEVPAPAVTLVEELAAPEAPPLEEEEAPAPLRPTVRETYVIPAEERAAPPPAALPARTAPRFLRWLVPAAAAALGLALVVPRLTRQPEPAVAAAETRPTGLVEFVVPGDSQLFLDGSPLPSNPIALAQGGFHTVTAVAGGRVVGTEKFQVDQARKTIRVRVGAK
jgi:hypothetical protein